MKRRQARPERRTQNIKSLVYGTVYRRRLGNRRSGDNQWVIPDVHEASTCLLALGVIIMSCMDALLTLNIIRLGGEELNVAMRVLLESSTFSFLLVKYCATAGGVILLLLFARMRIAGVLQVSHILSGLFVIYSGLILYHIILIVIATSTV